MILRACAALAALASLAASAGANGPGATRCKPSVGVRMDCAGPPVALEVTPAPGGAVSPPPPPPPGAPAANIPLSGALSQGGMVIGTAPPGVVSLRLYSTEIPIAADRHFLLAFSMTQQPVTFLIAGYADGTTRSDRLTIAPRDWPVEALPIPKYKQPSEAFLQLRTPELAQIGAARTASRSVRSSGWEQSFAWPAAGRLSGRFGARRVYNGEEGAPHSGADVAIPTGTPVRAPADGVVLLAARDNPFTLEGHLLVIGHGMGLDSALLHLSRINVSPGETVRKGQIVGLSGASGRATGPHLHWSLTWTDPLGHAIRIDPLLVAGMPPGGGS